MIYFKILQTVLRAYALRFLLALIGVAVVPAFVMGPFQNYIMSKRPKTHSTLSFLYNKGLLHKDEIRSKLMGHPLVRKAKVISLSKLVKDEQISFIGEEELKSWGAIEISTSGNISKKNVRRIKRLIQRSFGERPVVIGKISRPRGVDLEGLIGKAALAPRAIGLLGLFCLLFAALSLAPLLKGVGRVAYPYKRFSGLRFPLFISTAPLIFLLSLTSFITVSYGTATSFCMIFILGLMALTALSEKIFLRPIGS